MKKTNTTNLYTTIRQKTNRFLLCVILLSILESTSYAVPEKWESGYWVNQPEDDSQPSLAALGAGIIGGAVTTGITYLLYHNKSKSYQSKYYFGKPQSPYLTI